MKIFRSSITNHWLPGARRTGLAIVALLIGLSGVEASAQAVTQLPDDDQVLELTASELYRIGGIDADPWETFGENLQLSFGPDGGLYVLDRSGYRVVAIGPDGARRTEFGNEGEGPGEFRSPSGLVVTPEGDVVVLDFAARSFSIFDPQGEYRQSIRIPVVGGSFSMGSIQADPRGGGVYSAPGGGGMMMMSMESRDGAPPPVPEPGIPIQRFSLAGEPVETLHRAWDPRGSAIPQVSIPGGGRGRGGVGGIRIGGGQMAFRPTLRWAVTPDGGVAFIDSTTYRIQLMDTRGQVGRVLTRDVAPIPVTDRLKEQEKARRFAALEAGEGPQMRVAIDNGRGAQTLGQAQVREMQREQLESLGFWDEVAPVRGLAVDALGRLWVERGGADPSEPGPIDLVSFSGAYLGTIPADGLRTPRAFGPNGLVAYIETDEYDVPTIVVKRLSNPGL